MDPYDYSTELVSKWENSGHLCNVAEQDRIKVAQRLEAAHRRSLGQRGDSNAIESELYRLKKEGYVASPVPELRNNRNHWMKR